MTTSAAEDATVRIRAVLNSLHPAERRVADYVLKDPELVAGLSITRLATNCDTSEATISRLVRSLGYAGYKDFRLAVARASALASAAVHGESIPSSDIDPNEPLDGIITKLSYSDRSAIEDTAKTIDLEQFVRVRDALTKAGRAIVFGVGASALVASDLALKLQRIDRAVWALSDPDRAAGAAALLSPEDMVIVISASGQTAASVGVQRAALRSGAVTVAITSNLRSPLATEADLVLLSASRETTFRSGATSSRIAQLFIVDCLFVAVASGTHASSTIALEKTRDAVRRLHAD